LQAKEEHFGGEVMKFTVTTKYGQSLTWEDGKVSGDLLLVEVIESQAKLREGQFVGKSYLGGTEKDHMNSPLSVYLILEELFGELRHEGDKIPIEKLPKGDRIVS